MARYGKPLPGALIDPGHRLSSALMGCWLFNEMEGTTLRDISLNSNHATLNNLEHQWVGSPDGGSVLFKGTGSNNNITSAKTPQGTSITLTAWIWHTGSPEGHIIEYTPLQTYINTSDVLKFYGGSAYTSTEPTIPRNTWVHVAFTGSSSGHFIWVNGRLASESSNSSGLSSPSSVIYIGKWSAGTDTFNGKISNCRIYHRVLSADEIFWLYREPFVGIVNSSDRRKYFISATRLPKPMLVTRQSNVTASYI